MYMFSYFTLMAMTRAYLLRLNFTHRSLIKMLILEENSKWYLEAFASEFFLY